MVGKKYTLKELSKRKGVKVITLAMLLECSTQTIYNYMTIKMSDDWSIPSDHLKALAEFFDVKMEDLYTASETKNQVTAG